MLAQECCENEALYQLLLAEYKLLEAEAPLCHEDAARNGERKFNLLMGHAIEAGHYDPEWLESINDFSAKVHALLTEMSLELSHDLYSRFLGIQGDVRQINPAEFLSPASSRATTHADTISDQLAQGATLCQLF